MYDVNEQTHYRSVRRLAYIAAHSVLSPFQREQCAKHFKYKDMLKNFMLQWSNSNAVRKV